MHQARSRTFLFPLMLCKEASTLNFAADGRDDFHRNFFQVNLAIFLWKALVLTVSAHSLLSGLITLHRTGPLDLPSVHIHLHRVSGASSSLLDTTIEKTSPFHFKNTSRSGSLHGALTPVLPYRFPQPPTPPQQRQREPKLQSIRLIHLM